MRFRISLACAVSMLCVTVSARTRPDIVIIEAAAGLVSDSAVTALFPEGYRFVYAYGEAEALDGLDSVMSSNGYAVTRSLAEDGHAPLFMRIGAETRDALYGTVSELRQSGLYDEALVIFTSACGDTPYHDSWHIRMTVKLPASKGSTLPRGSVIADPVTAADIPPTVLQAAGIGRDNGAGESMLPLIRRKAKAWRHYVYFVNDEYVAVTDGRFKYILHRDGSGEELYNLLVDPCETENIAGRRSILLETMRKAAYARY